jgi:DNA phosphorothioation-associated putative methyltransferase
MGAGEASTVYLPDTSCRDYQIRGRTAMVRSALSRPVARALEDGIITESSTVLDYGCGRGGDVRRLRDRGIPAHGWDPVHAPLSDLRPADIVNLAYVVNVIEDPRERREVLVRAWELTRRTLIVAARPDWEARTVRGRSFSDGCRTAIGTFQKFYTQEELRSWIETTLGTRSVAAAPGVFYVFRDERDAQQLLASRVRVRISMPRQAIPDRRIEEYRGLLEPLADFVVQRGRLPVEAELAQHAEIASTFGSFRAASALVRRMLSEDVWNSAQQRATDDLLVYLALSAFQVRPRWSDLPEASQRDVKTFFGSYKNARRAADDLLFAVAKPADLDKAIHAMSFGKLLPDAIYVHTAYLNRIPSLLRVYEGCARMLVGVVPEATVIKLQRVNRRVAYLSYPRFERDAHPELSWSIRADLRSFDVKWRDFRDSANPPILHRKETFLAADHQAYAKYARLTQQEERAGLLGSATIGTKLGWERALASAGLRVAGHRLCRAVAQEPADIGT